jgi:glycosyltransferase involved in cell wall biosynthesis
MGCVTRIPASVLVLAKNEEANIAECLQAVREFAEVVVVDSSSTDRTTDLALQHGARVVNFEWNGAYPKKKQWALDNAQLSHRWVLLLDADERVTPELATEISKTLRTPGDAGYFVGLDYFFLGKLLRHGQRVYKLILFDRTRGRFEEYDDLEATTMWEVEGHYQPRVDGSIGTLKSSLVHHDHDSLFNYFERHNRYSDWEAVLRHKPSAKKDVLRDGRAGHRTKEIFDALPFKSLAFFSYSYFIQRGFLDGRAGYHYALAKAFYYWQIRVKELELASRGAE